MFGIDDKAAVLLGAATLSLAGGISWAGWCFKPERIVLAFVAAKGTNAPADDGEYVENLKAEYRTAVADPSGTRIYWNTFNATEAEQARHDRLVSVAERALGLPSEGASTAIGHR